MILQLTIQQKLGLIVVIIAVSFVAGRYSVSQPVVKTQEQVKTNIADNTNTNTKQHKVIITVKEPNGETKTTETVDTDTDTKAVSVETQAIVASQTVTPQKTGTVNVYLIGAYNLSSPLQPPLTGIGVSAKLLGPINVGVQGLFGANNLIGITAGLTF